MWSFSTPEVCNRGNGPAGVDAASGAETTGEGGSQHDGQRHPVQSPAEGGHRPGALSSGTPTGYHHRLPKSCMLPGDPL
ncbi:MAG: hypothetical protein K0R62_8434 [Nonomuraea muscovyensis]|nr:hypothetical protein [Nonomuraea muscovyensis]